MKVVGYNDNQGRPIYQPLVVRQGSRHILYLGNSGGEAFNSLTGRVEPNGTSIVDVSDVAHPQFLAHIPGPSAQDSAGSQMVRACSGSVLPQGVRGKWYLLRSFGNAGANTAQQIWDVTDPAKPRFLLNVVSGVNNTHKSWWECDTGIAYIVAGAHDDGWHIAGPHQHVKIFALSNPAKPVLIRDYGLPGQQPSADVATAKSCTNAPGPNCYEGTANPPWPIHGPISAGVAANRVFLPYGIFFHGVVQIVDRRKLIDGCHRPGASPTCATHPSQADLLYPQVGYITLNRENGAHSAVPILHVPMPYQQANYGDGKPQSKDLLIVSSETVTNGCLGEEPHDAWIIDITDDAAPWPVSTLAVPQYPGDFCNKGGRFGAHAVTEAIYPPYQGKIIGVSWFNAGARFWDIRNPEHPKPIAYFIQAPNAKTEASCRKTGAKTQCRKVTENDYVEYDDRGYIYAADRAGSGVTILKFTGGALKVLQ